MPKITNLTKPTPAGLAYLGNALIATVTYVASSTFFPIIQLSKTASAILLGIGTLGAFLTNCFAAKENNDVQKN